MYALCSEWVVAFTCGLRYLRADVLNVPVNGDGLQLGVVVLDHPVETDIVTVVLGDHVVPHLLHLKQVGVVKIHEVSTDEGQTYQADIEKILCLSLAVLEPLAERVLIVARTVGNNGANAANGIFAPYFEPLLELLAINSDIIIDREKYL